MHTKLYIMVKKAILGVLLLCQTLLLHSAPFTVVIDAGHGGKDAGAVGRKGVLEKNLNLDVSIRLASKIRTQYPEVQVLLTRSSDVFLPLQSRADFVNKNNADLFICIHTNAAESRSAHGTEVFILGTDKMEQNLDVAMRENAVIKLESDYQTAYQGFDPNSVESYIMFELMQNRYIDQSLQFASLVQNEFTNTLHRADRGVRQAAFWVLLKSACPSVLVEMGFVSNADEEQYLKSDQGKREITDALFAAFCNYYKHDPHPAQSEAQPEAQPEVQPVDDCITDTVKLAPIPAQSPLPIQPVQQPAPQAKKEVWKVQIFVSRTVLPKGDSTFKGVTSYSYKQANGWYKYMTGNCATREEAAQLRDKMKDKFPDCFIVKCEE